jgi:hypothetical protein
MASWYVLGIVFLMLENRGELISLVRFYQGNFSFYFIFHEFRNFKMVLFLCTYREKGLINKVFMSLFSGTCFCFGWSKLKATEK